MYKYVPRGTHRQPVERADDYAVYVYICSRVKARREEVLERFGPAATGCIGRLINLGVIDNVCLVHRDGNHKWQYEVPLKD